jgi:hypothetical protein
MRMRCPHCKSSASIRTSTEITVLLREMSLICSNPACGHTFIAATEINRTLSPSAIPDPNVRLPLSKHVQRRELVQQLMTLPTAEPRAPMPTSPEDSAERA